MKEGREERKQGIKKSGGENKIKKKGKRMGGKKGREEKRKRGKGREIITRYFWHVDR